MTTLKDYCKQYCEHYKPQPDIKQYCALRKLTKFSKKGRVLAQGTLNFEGTWHIDDYLIYNENTGTLYDELKRNCPMFEKFLVIRELEKL